MIVFGLWLVQGLNGAPRRWSVLPSQYDSLTRISLVFVFVLAAAQALFFWNVLQTLRGKGGVATFDERGIPSRPTSSKEWSVHAAEGALVLVALFLAGVCVLGGYLIGREHGRGRGGARPCRRVRPAVVPSPATRRPVRRSSRAPVAAAATRWPRPSHGTGRPVARRGKADGGARHRPRDERQERRCSRSRTS